MKKKYIKWIIGFIIIGIIYVVSGLLYIEIEKKLGCKVTKVRLVFRGEAA